MCYAINPLNLIRKAYCAHILVVRVVQHRTSELSLYLQTSSCYFSKTNSHQTKVEYPCVISQTAHQQVCAVCHFRPVSRPKFHIIQNYYWLCALCDALVNISND